VKSILAAIAMLAVITACTDAPRTQEYFDAHLDERATELKRCERLAPARLADDQNCWAAGQSDAKSALERTMAAAAASQAAATKRFNELLNPGKGAKPR
jgi:hypothetical protein